MSDAVCMLDGGWLYVDTMQNKGKKRCWGALETFNKKTNLANSLIKTKTKKGQHVKEMCYKRLLNPCPSVFSPFHLPVWFDTGRYSLAFVQSGSKGMRRSPLQIQSFKTFLWLSSHSLASTLAVPHIHFLSSPMLSQSPHLKGRSQDLEGQLLLVVDGLEDQQAGKWSCRV